MGVVLGRPAMSRPAGMSDADRAFERLALKPALEIFKLAFGAPPRELAVFERCHARGIIAAIFGARERIDQLRRCYLTVDDSDNSAHPWSGKARKRTDIVRFHRSCIAITSAQKKLLYRSY